jgi:hypothetical protein
VIEIPQHTRERRQHSRFRTSRSWFIQVCLATWNLAESLSISLLTSDVEQMKLSKQKNRPTSRRLRHRKSTRNHSAKMQQQIMCVSRYCLNRLPFSGFRDLQLINIHRRLSSRASSPVTISTPYPPPSRLRQYSEQVSKRVQGATLALTRCPLEMTH